jgi:hypothetical protein
MVHRLDDVHGVVLELVIFSEMDHECPVASFTLTRLQVAGQSRIISVRCDLLTAATLHSIDCRLCQAPCGFLELYFPPFLSVISGGTVAIQIGNECDI